MSVFQEEEGVWPWFFELQDSPDEDFLKAVTAENAD